jgi:putative Mn2+ efflux pump MntP
MPINPIGLAAAIAAFLGIWLGHVSVRLIERNAKRLWQPILIAIALGLSLEIWSLFTENWLLNTSLGILGITILWDALEFARQEKRVRKGHAPADPANPRHAQILAEYPSATVLDLLKRDPVGRQVDPNEAIQLIQTVDHRP